MCSSSTKHNTANTQPRPNFCWIGSYSALAFLVLCWAFGHTHRASIVRDFSCLLHVEAHKNYRIFWSGVSRCIVWAYNFCIEKVWNVWAPEPGNVLPLGRPNFGEGPPFHWWKAKCRLFLCFSLASHNLAHITTSWKVTNILNSPGNL